MQWDVSQAGAVTLLGTVRAVRELAAGSLCHRWAGLRSMVLKGRGCREVCDLMLHCWDIEE